MEPSLGYDGTYGQGLSDLEDSLVEGAFRVAEAVGPVSRALAAGDTTIVGAAQTMADDVLARLEDVEERSLRLLTRDRPSRADARLVIALLRLVTHVERAAALLLHVAESTQRLAGDRLPEEMRALLVELSTRSGAVYRRGVDAWRVRDAEAITAIARADADVDTLQVELLQHANACELPNAELVSIGLIARYYERIADHGVAFARDVAFLERPGAA